MARQRLGQHFLSDPNWREQIARAIRVSSHSLIPDISDAHLLSSSSAENAFCWVEIGAGHGEMTEHIAAAGAPVYAIELDTALARRLQRLKQRFPNLTVISSDVLKVDFAEIAAGRRLRMYGNLPYYITSPILHRVFESAALIDEMHIVVVPIVLGRGVRLWDGLEGFERRFTVEPVSSPSGVTHLTFTRR